MIPTARELLESCLRAHPVSVTIRELDVIRDTVGLRCGECRRMFDLQVSAFESTRNLSRMLKRSASCVLASTRSSTYPEGTPPDLVVVCGLAGRSV